MKYKLLYQLIIFSIFLPACNGSAAPTISATFKATEAITTAQPEITQPLVIETASIKACKIRPAAFTNVGLGLPNPSYKLPSVGTVKTVVLFADFNDVPASQTPEEILAVISPQAETFFREISYGRMDWKLEPHLQWLRLSQPSAHYGEGIRSYAGHLQFIQEAVNLADAEVDFSTVDSVVVMIPPEAYSIGYGPAFGAHQGQGYIADGKVFENGITSGADLLNWGFLWLNHEGGHTLGLPDLYAYQFDVNRYEDQHRFVGGFGLMGYIDGKAPEYFAYERWQLGWLDDGQIICGGSGEQTVVLTPVESAGSVKALIIPMGGSKVLVVESRRALGYDINLPKAGALVYTVDTSVFSGEGPLIVYPLNDGDPYREQAPLAPGESITVEGVTITVVDATKQGDTILVTAP